MSMEAETRTQCWCCHRKQAEKQFVWPGVGTEKEVEMNRDAGKVTLRVTRMDGQRDDGKRLCKTCVGHILNEAADAALHFSEGIESLDAP